MLDKHTIYIYMSYCSSFSPLTLDGNLKTTPWNSQLVSRFPAGFAPSPSSYSSPVLLSHISLLGEKPNLLCCSHTNLIPHSAITVLLIFHSLHQVANVCCNRKSKRGMKSITPAMRGSRALINDPVHSQARLLYDRSLWGPFITDDMMPDDALLQQL